MIQTLTSTETTKMKRNSKKIKKQKAGTARR